MRSIWFLTMLAKSFVTRDPGDIKPATSNVLDAQYPKVQHIFNESPGADHEWQTWRRDLKDFAPRLFQSAAHLPLTVRESGVNPSLISAP